MKGLTDFSLDEYLAADKGIVVYLESTDDVFVFKKWFGDLLSKIQFESISGEKADGGCGAIIKFFEEQPNLEFAYGVVDRDVLLGNIDNNKYPACGDLWWNKNDEDFYATHPFGSKVFILNRWELENYLLHPEALQKLLENKTRGETSLNTASKVAKEIIENESDLLAFTLFSMPKTGSSPKERYAQNDASDELWSKVDNFFQSKDDVNNHKNKITSFAENKVDPLERWDRLSRLLDGKRIMCRLERILHKSDGFHLDKEYGTLADNIVNLGLVDPDLKNWLTNVSS